MMHRLFSAARPVRVTLRFALGVILAASAPVGVTLATEPSIDAAPAAAPHSALSREPFYAGIVSDARALHTETEAFAADLSLMSGQRYTAYERRIRALAAANMQGHEDLKARGTDNDLKCILKGVSLDLTIKMDALAAATDAASRTTTLTDMAYLLSDNIDVIVTPATADSGLDCVIEFGS